MLDVAEEVQPKKCLDGMTNVERAADVTSGSAHERPVGEGGQGEGDRSKGDDKGD
jgi:hypothetical protein